MNSITFPVTEMQAQTIDGRLIPYKAIIRQDTNEVIATVRDTYEVIKHEDVLRQITNRLDLDDSTMKVSTYRNGAGMIATFDLKDSRTVLKNDHVDFKVRVFNSYDYSTMVGYQVIGMRLACLNGMVIPGTIASMNIRHRSGANVHINKEQFTEKLNRAFSAMNIWQQWAKLPAKQERIEEYNNKYLNNRVSERIMSTYESKYRPELGPNLWGYFNALTDYSSHQLTMKNKSNLELKRLEFEKVSVLPFYYFNWN